MDIEAIAGHDAGNEDGVAGALFTRLLDHSPVVLYCRSVAPGMPIRYVSAAVTGLLDHAPADFVAASGFWREHLHPDDRGRVEEALAATLDGGRLACEYRLRTRAGAWRWLRDEANAVRDARGRPLELIGSWRDIGERRRHTEIEQAARNIQVGELAAGLAHELNQPLAAIIYTLSGAARCADQGTLDDGRAEAALRGAIAHAHRAAEIVAHVRSAMARGLPQRSRLRLGEVVAEMIAVSRHAADAAGVRLLAEIGDDVPPLFADRVQIEQVLLNLIRNGIESVAAACAPRRRSVLVEAARVDARRVEVAVEDSGAGLTADARARLFDPFYTTKENGMGLGLAICQSIVEEHGGAIRAEPAVGGGLRVAFSLPLEQA